LFCWIRGEGEGVFKKIGRRPGTLIVIASGRQRRSEYRGLHCLEATVSVFFLSFADNTLTTFRSEEEDDVEDIPFPLTLTLKNKKGGSVSGSSTPGTPVTNGNVPSANSILSALSAS